MPFCMSATWPHPATGTVTFSAWKSSSRPMASRPGSCHSAGKIMTSRCFRARTPPSTVGASTTIAHGCAGAAKHMDVRERPPRFRDRREPGRFKALSPPIGGQGCDDHGHRGSRNILRDLFPGSRWASAGGVPTANGARRGCEGGVSGCGRLGDAHCTRMCRCSEAHGCARAAIELESINE